MADLLSISRVPEFSLNITHAMGDGEPTVIVVSASPFSIEVGVAASVTNFNGTGANGGGLSAADQAKLDGIELLAKDDQTGAEIKALYEAEENTNAYTNAEKTALGLIEPSATADQSGGEIKTLYEAEANTNAYTDTEKTKLAGVETAATADQTGAQIKVAYEAEADTNALTDALKTKLDGMEASATADQTNAEIETAYNAQVAKVSAGEITAGTEVAVRRFSPDDVEAMVIAHAPAGKTDAQIKTAYENNVDTNEFSDTEQTKLAGIETAATADQTNAEIRTAVGAATDSNVYDDAAVIKLGKFDEQHYGAPLATTTALTALTEASLFDKERRFVEGEIADFFYDSVASSGDFAPDDQTGGTGFWLKIVASGDTAASIKTKYESNANTNEYDDAEQSKLAAIEAGATADQTGAEIKTAYQAEANAFTDAKNTKLSGIETAATADQTNAEIRTAVEAATDSNVFNDADHTKLNAIEASATADQTNAEIETAYNAQVAKVSAGEITAGTEVAVRRFSPDDVEAMVVAHAPGGSSTAINTQTSTAYTLALTDAEDIVEMSDPAANVLTIPLNSSVNFPVPTLISVTMLDVGITTITAAAGVKLNGVLAGSGTINGQFGGISLYQRATNEWIMQGAIATISLWWNNFNGASGAKPVLVLDYAGDVGGRYMADEVIKTFAELHTFARASTALHRDSFGLVVSAATDAHRLDHDKTGNRVGLRLEEARTNLMLQSSDILTTWTNFNTSLAANAATAPDGTVTADKILDNNAGGSTGVRIQQSLTLAATSTYVLSTFAKKDGTDMIYFEGSGWSDGVGSSKVWFNLTTGVVGTRNSGWTSSGMDDYGDGWYRCWAVFDTATDTSGSFRIGPAQTDATHIVDLDGTSSIFVWEAQLELGAYHTSPIPTTTVSVTRAAETCTVAQSKFAMDLTKGAMSVEFTPYAIQVDTDQYLAKFNGSGADVLIQSVASNQINTSVNAILSSGTTIANDTTHKVMVAYDQSDGAFSVNGAASLTFNPSTFTLTTADLTIGTNQLGPIKSIAYYNTRMINSDIEGLTT